MLSRKKISDRMGAFYYYPINTVVVNLVIGIILFIVGQKFIYSASVQLEFTLLLFAIEAAVTILIFWFRYEFKQYFRREYIQEIVSAGGKTTRELHAYIVDKYDGKGITTLFPGKDYILEFNLKGGVLAKNLLSRKLTPRLRMFPALFLGNQNLQKLEKETSMWDGTSEIVSSSDDSNSWGVKGSIAFDTSKLNPSTKLTEEIQLVLEFWEDETVVFTFGLGKFIVHLLNKQELLSKLIGFGALKKVPPGYDVLKITHDYYFTNIVFLPQVLINLKKDRDTEDKVDEVEVAIANMIQDEFQELQKNSREKLSLLVYDPEPYEQDLNVPEFLNNILSATNLIKPTTSKLRQEVVYVSTFQTPEFLSKLDKGASGICLFGFKQFIPKGFNLTVIFDLSNLTLPPISSIDDCVINKPDLYELIDCSPKYFKDHASKLEKELSKTGITTKLSANQGVDISSCSSWSLDDLLSELQKPFDNSQKKGRFVISEPGITKIWVNLAIFSNKLNEINLRNKLIQSIFLLIDLAKKNYTIHPDNLIIVNLCSEQSGISNELSTLWNLDQISEATYKIPCYNVVIDSKNGEVTLESKGDVATSGQLKDKDVILLVPLDSYVKVIKKVLEYVRGQEINVIAIISLFSIATNWDFATASEFFDVLPLFQVDPNLKGQHHHRSRITQRDDIRRLRPWLVSSHHLGAKTR